MGIPPSEARSMTLWEYEATLVEWNISHRVEEVERPSVDDWIATIDFFDDNKKFLN